ncbi:uncharacterized protein [Procambarus clarkii]|uniref:uncharacterized protein n=1 Tax=Procambarus clarkii TaxID=6728 RepID=UPI003743C60A
MKLNELRNSNPRLAELTTKQECGTCGQVLDQRSQGLESCSGSAKILGGFREVGQILESWDPTSPHSSHSPFRTTRTSSAKDTTPVTTIVCDIHKVNGLNGDVTTSNTYPGARFTKALTQTLTNVYIFPQSLTALFTFIKQFTRMKTCQSTVVIVINSLLVLRSSLTV